MGFKAHDERHGGRLGRQVALGRSGLFRRIVEVSVAEEKEGAPAPVAPKAHADVEWGAVRPAEVSVGKKLGRGRPKKEVGSKSAAERAKAYRDRRKGL
jgi:hypothetical protein